MTSVPNRSIVRALLLLAAMAWVPAQAGTHADAPAYAPGAPTGATAFAFDQHPGAQAPIDAPLQAPDGATTSIRALAAGRPVVLVLNYLACPNLCGVVRDDIFAALADTTLDAAGYLAAAVSIDPAETPADATRAAHDAPRGVRYLTGNAAPLEQAVGFRARWDAREKQFLHPAGVVVLTPGGVVSSYLLGVGYQPADVQRAVEAATAGTVMAPANPILLLCFHYDPVTGRYSLAITRILQLASALTVAAVGAGLLLAHRRKPV